MKSTLKYALLALSAAFTLQTAQGVVVFSDNFDTETLGTNLTPSQWTLVSGTVDIIGDPGFFDFLPGNGRYLDMDGSTQSGGWIEHGIFLTAGNYVFSFDYAGNNRGDQSDIFAAGVYTNAGNNPSSLLLSQDYDPAWNAGFVTASIPFSLASDQQVFLAFDSYISNDNVGSLLDNVKLERIDRPNGVPEGSAGLVMLGLALGSLAGARRFVRRQS